MQPIKLKGNPMNMPKICAGRLALSTALVATLTLSGCIATNKHYHWVEEPNPRLAQAYQAPAPAPVPVQAPAPPQQGYIAPTLVTLSADALFDFASATLRPAGRESLSKLARDLNAVQYNRLLISGFTDRLGSDVYNQHLSQQRAEAVRDYLIGAGIPAAAIRANGYGKSHPVTDARQCPGEQRTPTLITCLQPDRRVEVEISGLRQL
jgi:OOP family OmpA-OmpF porin